jgi:hypothetical protein
VCGVIRWSRWGVAGAVAGLVLAGCGDNSPGPVLPPLPSSGSPSVSASPSPSAKPTGRAEEQILAQYRRFWRDVYVGLYAVSASEREIYLRPVVTTPLLAELIRVARENDQAGTELRGTPVSLDPVVTRQGGEAVVSDCVDLTGVVLVDRSTGKVVSRERADRRPIESRLRRGTDGVWRAFSLNDLTEYEC